ITDEDLIEELLGMSKEDAEDKLKEEGYTDEEITAYFEMQDETKQYLKDVFGIEDEAEIENILSMNPDELEQYIADKNIDILDIEGIESIEDFIALSDSEKLEKLITYLAEEKGMDYATATERAAEIISDLNTFESEDAIATYLSENWSELQKEDWLDTFMEEIADLNTYQQKQRLMEMGLTEEQATEFFGKTVDHARIDYLMNECGLDEWSAALWVGKELQEDGSLKRISYSSYLEDVYDAIVKAAEDLGYGKQEAEAIAKDVVTDTEAQVQDVQQPYDEYTTEVGDSQFSSREQIVSQPGAATDVRSSEAPGFSDAETEAIVEKVLIALLLGDMNPDNAYDVAKAIISEVAGATAIDVGNEDAQDAPSSSLVGDVVNDESNYVTTTGVASQGMDDDTSIFADQYRLILIETHGEEEGLKRYQEWYLEYMNQQ
ncbi:MAG: hypothetical protein P9M06_06950, partial [Candidatus Saelkia tenebricola]|nr:hypothetical protein [Candidatus Saelkia tenebricola]